GCVTDPGHIFVHACGETWLGSERRAQGAERFSPLLRSSLSRGMNGRHAVLARLFDVRCRGLWRRQRLERGMLRIRQQREESQIIAYRRADAELAKPRRAPRKHAIAIGQTNAR